jgi:hypothetical protein
VKVRSGVIAFAVVALLGLTGLVASASVPRRWTAFSAQVPAAVFVGNLAPKQMDCQGPIDPPSAFSEIEFWVWPVPTPGPGLYLIAINPRSNAILATARVAGGYSAPSPPTGYPNPMALRARFSANIPAGQKTQICMLAVGSSSVLLMGSAPSGISGVLKPGIGDGHYGALAMRFLTTRSQSLLSVLPTAFSRAALFRPGWVGAWTFWALAVALLGAFGLAAFAVKRASGADLVGSVPSPPTSSQGS